MAQIKKFQNPAGPITQTTPIVTTPIVTTPIVTTPVVTTPETTPPKKLTYKGIEINDNIREGYKQYMKDWAQANITGFNQGEQHSNITNAILDVDKELASGNLPTYNYSTQDPHKNIFASFEGKDSKDIALAGLHSYLEKTVEANPHLTQTSTTAAPTKTFHGFMDPMRDIAQTHFGGLPNFEERWKDTKTYDESTRKGFVQEALLRQINKLAPIDFTDPNNEIVGVNQDTFNNLKTTGKLAEYQKALATKDLDTTSLLKIADNLGQGAITAKLLNIIPEKELTPEEIANKKVEETSKNLISAGIPTDVAQTIAGKGMKYDPNFKFQDSKTQQLIEKHNGIILFDPTGKKIVLDKNTLQPFSYIEKSNPFASNYGESWGNSQEGFKQWSPANIKFNPNYNPANFQDKYKSENIGRQLITNMTPDWKVFGWSQENALRPDILSGQARDFTKELVLENKGQKIKLVKGSDNKYYREGESTPFAIQPKILGYGTESRGINDWSKVLNANPEFSHLLAEDNHLPTEQAFSLAKDQTNKLNNFSTDYDSTLLKATIRQLKYIISRSTNPEEKGKAAQSLGELSQGLKKYNQRFPNAIVLKEGGIIKGQQGISVDEYMKKYATNKNPQTGVQTTNEKPRDISKLASNMSGLDATILGANALSLAPGFAGVAGAAGATVLEGYKDFSDPNTSALAATGNLALNLGLIGASFIGVGALRGLIKGSKIGKDAVEALKIANEVDKFGDTAKIAKTFSETTKADEIAKSIKTIDDFADANNTSKNLSDILKVAQAAKDTKTETEIGKVIGFSKELAKSKQIIPTLSVSMEKVGKGIQQVGRYGAYGNAFMNLGGAKDAVSKVVSGNVADLTTDDLNAATSVLFGAHMLNRQVRMGIGQKYGLIPTESTPANIETNIKGKTITLEDDELINLAKKRKLPFTKENTTVKQALIDKYNESLPEGTEKLTLDEFQKLKPQISINDKTESDFKIRDKVDINKDYWMQTMGKKFATKYRLAPNSTPIQLNNEVVSNIPTSNVITPDVVIPTTKPISIPQENPLSKRTKPLVLPNAERQSMNLQKAKEFQAKKKTDKLNNKLLDEWQIPFSKQGGILKAESGIKFPINGIYTGLGDPSQLFKDKGGVWNKEVNSGSTQWKWTNQLPEVVVKANKTTVPLTTNPIIQTSDQTAKPGVFTPITNKPASFDLSTLAEGAKYLLALNANKRNAQIMMTAPVMKSMTQEYSPVMTDLTSQMAYQNAGANAMKAADIQARGTSDYGTSAAIRMEGVGKQNDLSIQGKLANANMYNKTLENSTNIANKVKEYNLNVGDVNNQSIQTARDYNNRVEAGKTLADYQSGLELLTDIKEGYGANKQREAYNKQLDTQQAARKDYTNLYNKIQEEQNFEGEEGYKKNPSYLEFASKFIEGKDPSETTPEKIDLAWRQGTSPQYQVYKKDYESRYGDKSKMLNTLLENYQNSQTQYATNPYSISFRSPWYASKLKAGGSLSNKQKVQLENLKLAAKNKDTETRSNDKALDRKERQMSKILDGLSKESMMLLQSLVKKK